MSSANKKNQLLLACGVLFVLLASCFCSTVTAAASDTGDGAAFARANKTDELLHKDDGRITVDEDSKDITVKLNDSDMAEGHKTEIKLHRIDKNDDELSYTMIRPLNSKEKCSAYLRYDSDCGIDAEWLDEKFFASSANPAKHTGIFLPTQKDVEIQHSGNAITFDNKKAELTTKCKLATSKDFDFSISTKEGSKACEFAVQFSGEKYELEASTTTPAPTTTEKVAISAKATMVRAMTTKGANTSSNSNAPTQSTSKETFTGTTEKAGMKTGSILGIVAGCLVSVSLVVGGVIFGWVYFRKRKDKATDANLEAGRKQSNITAPPEMTGHSFKTIRGRSESASSGGSTGEEERDDSSRKRVPPRKKPKKVSRVKPKQLPPKKPKQVSKKKPKQSPPSKKNQQEQQAKNAERNYGQIDLTPATRETIQAIDREPKKDASYVVIGGLGEPQKSSPPKN